MKTVLIMWASVALVGSGMVGGFLLGVQAEKIPFVGAWVK